MTGPWRTSPGVIDTGPGSRHGFEPRRRDRLAALHAEPVRAVVESGQSALDLVQLVLEGRGERQVLTLLSGDLTRIGEVLVEIEGAIAFPGQTFQPLQKIVALAVQLS